MLFRWLRREGPPHLVVRDCAGRCIDEPLSVDWCNFPLEQGIEAALALGYPLSQRPARCA
jgi:hypothetical protein